MLCGLAQKARKHYTPAMSYLQEAQLSAAHVETMERRSSVLSGRVALALLMVLAFLHGALYAAFLPPWGLIDEAQHLHYIQYIAEEQMLPVAGDLYLSEEIVASLFATRRWETFHWTPPPAPDPLVMGLEGHSYEAYQPPLFYLLMTPAYWLLPDDMLVKVYGLRAVVVLISLITVWATYRTAQVLLPHYPRVPFWAGLLLVAIPERAFATSRINNDVLLEVVAALLILTLTHALVAGTTRRRAFLLGLLLGLSVWVKVSAGVLGVPVLLLLWWQRRKGAMWRQVGWVALATAPFGILLVLRNLVLYGDLTGFGSFDQLHRLAPTDTSFAGIVQTLISLPNHLWLVWWKGSDVGSNALLTFFYGFMAIVLAVAWGRLYADVARQRLGPTLASAAIIYGATVLINALAVLSSYYEGMVPVLQGRFMLPAIVPFVLLVVWGLWRTGWGERILLATVIVLWGMGLFALFGNLVPYFYYWSEVLQGAMPLSNAVGVGELLTMIYQRMLEDKPQFISPLLWFLPLGYGAALVVTLVMALREMNGPSLSVSAHATPRVSKL